MQAILLALVLAAAPVSEAAPQVQSVAVVQSQHEAVDLADCVQTGTLIFSRGDCLAVKMFSRGPYTHVAAVVVREGEPYVYDSMSGVGVRRLALDEFIEKQRPDDVTLFQPAQPFSEKRAERFEKALDSKLGTPYSIKHHLTGKRSDGVHCSEYVTDALMSCNIIRAKSPPRVSPGSLLEGLIEAAAYTAGETFELDDVPQPSEPEQGNWCQRTWNGTKRCTIACCQQVRRWVWCK